MKPSLFVLYLFIQSIAVAQKYYPTIPFDSILYQGKKNFLSSPSLPPKEKRPNVILIVADDMGKFDLSVYGNPYIQTPHIDALGKEGVLFNAGYSSAAVCSPSRAGLITGRYQQRFGFHIQPHQRYPKNKFQLWAFQHLINTNDLDPEAYGLYPSMEERAKMGLPNSELSIADILKHSGYRTAQIGKWHLGYSPALSPENFGFDYCYGFKEAYSLYASPKDKGIVNARIKEFTDKVIWKGGRKNACAIYENGKEIEEKEYLTYAIVERAKKFISQQGNQPFFTYLAFNAPHTPYQAPKAIYDTLSRIQDHNKRVYESMLVALDDAIGQLTDYLKQTGQYENTLIVFTSDNGAALYTHTTDNKPLNGGKFTFFEGGVNVPLLVHFPKLIQHPSVINEAVSLLDILPTITELCDAPLPNDRAYDGYSLAPFLMGDRVKLTQRKTPIYWYSDYNSAIRLGDYKLILNDLDSTVDLYNLKEDPFELHNLSSNQKEVEKLKLLLEQRKKEMPHMYWPRIMNYEVEINGKMYRWAV